MSVDQFLKQTLFTLDMLYVLHVTMQFTPFFQGKCFVFFVHNNNVDTNQVLDPKTTTPLFHFQTVFHHFGLSSNL